MKEPETMPLTCTKSSRQFKEYEKKRTLQETKLDFRLSEIKELD